MKPFTIVNGVVAPLDQTNVDTDAIIPKQFLKSVKRTGFGGNLFDAERYLDPWREDCVDTERRPNSAFVLNRPEFSNASILLTRSNFGCGSSREHAPWALLDFGFRAIIAASFADIFFSNCFKNGLLPVCLPNEQIDMIFTEVAAKPGMRLEIDLASQRVTTAAGISFQFAINPLHKHYMLSGLDEIDMTLENAQDILAFEQHRLRQYPWLVLAMPK
jgi:3-isopropylmalate/(R)-2-methylmalate dehydratase small subunit